MPSVSTKKWLFVPVSTTSAFVLPSVILSVITPPRLEAGIQSKAVPVELRIEPAGLLHDHPHLEVHHQF